MDVHAAFLENFQDSDSGELDFEELFSRDSDVLKMLYVYCVRVLCTCQR